MFQYYIDVVTKHYVDFNGRARRSEFWYFTLVNLIIAFVLGFVGSLIHLGELPGNIYSLAVLLPSLGVAVRRLHDVGRSGWWLLIAFTIIGIFVLLYWYCEAGKSGSSEYGSDPKAMPATA